MQNIKILSVHDFHFSLKWLETSQFVGSRVAKVAREKGVDLIATSDWFNEPIIATTAGGLEDAQAIMGNWCKAARGGVVAVEGTPSHDGPGCYGIFEDMNLTVLAPGQVYGYKKGSPVSWMFDGERDLILFGVPELNKNTIQATLGLPAEKANAEAVRLFDEYVRGFIAPMRLKYKNTPAVGLLHGMVSDSSKTNSTDQIVKASDIVITTEMLEAAELDYWLLGHIHKPWSSEKIKASYPGSWGKSWSETGFLPAMELLTITDEGMIVERIPYGTPERRVVFSLSDVSDPAIAYWLKAKSQEDKEAFDKLIGENCHNWSRSTYEVEKTESRRVTKEEAEKARSLWDLFVLFDPSLAENHSLKEKVDQIQSSVGDRKPSDSMNVRMKSLKVQGCTFFGGREAFFDLEAVPTGLTALIGENGYGKSSLFSFCSPYPLVIGKDTKSGRQSAIKDFFDKPESLIEKRFDVDGVEHVHLITIKAAHTASPKTEVFITVNGIPMLDKATFDEAMEWCEKTYGPFEDYRITSFYEQPQQASDNRSGLMNAGRTAARNIVQNIAGIDREPEKRFALAKAAELETALSRDEAWINAAEEFLATSTGLPEEAETIRQVISGLRSDLERIKDEYHSKQEKVDVLVKEQAANNQKREQARVTEAKIRAKESRLASIEVEIRAAKESAGSAERLRAEIEEHEIRQKRLADLKTKAAEVERRNSESRLAHQKAVAEYRQIDSLRSRVASISELITRLVPCEHCGRLSSDAEQRRTVLEAEQKELEKRIESMKEPAPLSLEPVPHAEEIGELSAFVFDASYARRMLSEAERSEERIAALMKEELAVVAELKELTEWMKSNEIDEFIDDRVTGARQSFDSIRITHESESKELAQKEERLRSIEQQIEKTEEQKKEVEKRKAAIGDKRKDCEDWSAIARLLNPDKVPALELDLILDEIDAEATRNISPFLDGRFSYRTITKDQGKKEAVDRFDIILHDAETGREFSMFFTNPGNKAFYSDGYVKALISQRNQKMHRTFSPIISDEQDGPISPERVPMYYEIQRSYYANRPEKVLIVTQKKEVAAAYIENTVRIEEVVR